MMARIARFVPAVMGGGVVAVPLWSKVNAVAAANQVGQWRVAEASGTQAVDSSAQANHGTHSNVTLAVAGPDGLTVGSYASTPSFTNVYSSALNSDFNGQEGAAIVLAKVSAAGILADGLTHYLFRFRVSSSNYVHALLTNTTLSCLYRAGGVSSQINVTSLTAGILVNNWFIVFLTWSLSNNAFSVMLNGAQQGSTLTSLGTWSGNLATTTTCVGAQDTSGGSYWDGLLGRCTIWNTPVSLAIGATLVL